MIEIKLNKFQFAHGRKPNEWELGNWAFIFDGEQGRAFFVNYTRFSEASKEAQAEAKRRGASKIEVGS